jgi:selenocysteine lyase/cysteine desulfurase
MRLKDSPVRRRAKPLCQSARMALVSPDDFPGAAGYLNTASIGLAPAPAVAAMRAELDDWVAGRSRAPAYDAVVARARAAWARIHGVDPSCVAIGPQTSYFAGLVAASLPAGAEVVAYERDFASLLYPLLARDDLSLRFVPLEHVADAVGPHTALVAVSAVQSADGRVADLDAIAAAAGAHRALTVVDATQASGWLPIDASRFDFVITAAYKWMLSPRGSAFMSVRPELLESLPPLAAGWYAAESPWESTYGAPLRLAADARRLDMSPAWLPWTGTAEALEYTERVGVEAIREHDVRLANRTRKGLGLPPSDSAIVLVERDGAGQALADAGVVATAATGALRICFHLYNTDDDVDAVLGALTSP